MRVITNAELDAEVVALDARRGRGQLNFTLYRDIEAEPQKLWLVDDYLGAGELSCIFGPPGSGSLFWRAISLPTSLAVAHGSADVSSKAVCSTSRSSAPHW